MSWQELPLELDKLADSLRIAEGTMIAFAVVDTVPDRDALIRELRERLSGEAEICEIHLTPEQPNLLEQVSRGEVCLTPQGSDRAVYFVYGFEELSDEPRRQAIAGLNLQREALRRLSAPIVLWLAEGNLADVARLAPDFFSWRAGIYELRTALPLEQRAKAAIAEMLDSYSLSLIPACELRKRARLYEKLLSEQEDQPVPNPSAIAELYHNLGLIRYNLAEWGQASESFQKSLEVYEQLGDLAGLDRTYNNIGGIHYARGDYAAALGWYEKSVAICEKLGDPTRLAATYNNIGSIYDARGDYQVALELYEKSVAIFEKLGDQPGLATTYNNIGLIHYARGEYAAALEWYEKSIAICKKLSDLDGLAITYNNIGQIHYARGDYAAALEWYEKSVEIFERLGDMAGLARIYNNIGQVHYARGDYTAALERLERSTELRQEIGDKYGIAQSHYNMGMLLVSIGRLPDALSQFNQARKLYDEMGLSKEVAMTDARIAEVGARI